MLKSFREFRKGIVVSLEADRPMSVYYRDTSCALTRV